AVEVDVLAYDAALARGGRDDLEEAISLYRGPLLQDCVEEWVLPEREARAQAYLQALEMLAHQAGTDPGGAIRYLRLAVAADPLRESTDQKLMEALAAGGDYAAAVKVYRDLRQALHAELNVAPSPETAALFHRIRAKAGSKARDGPAARRGEVRGAVTGSRR